MSGVAPVVFLIGSLGRGGAERQLVALARGMQFRGRPAIVATMHGGGVLTDELVDAGIEVRVLEKPVDLDVPGFGPDLVRLVRRVRPSVLYTFMPSANVLGALVKPFLGGARVVWGVRSSDMHVHDYGHVANATFWLSRRVARFADSIIANSRAGRDHHQQAGYPADKLVVIENGIDTDRFRPRESLRSAVRAAWGIEPESVLVGLVARLDPMKDHETFLRAAAQVVRGDHGARFVCVGAGSPPEQERLRRLAAASGLTEGDLVWAGPRDDMSAVYEALDVLCLSSAFGEGFPNVVGEAMASGVPCVVTDVGDAARLVGDTGIAIPARSPALLAGALTEMVERVRSGAGSSVASAARERIVRCFSVDRMIARTLAHLDGLDRMSPARQRYR